LSAIIPRDEHFEYLLLSVFHLWFGDLCGWSDDLY